MQKNSKSIKYWMIKLKKNAIKKDPKQKKITIKKCELNFI